MARTDPEILLLGHADTVPGGPPVRLADGVLHGRVRGRRKGSPAAMICAAARFARFDLPARVVVVGAVDEERHSAGARYLVDRMWTDAVVIEEPSGSSCVGVGYKANPRIGVGAPAAHTSSPAAGAVEGAAELWATARERFARCNFRPGGPTLFDQALPSLVRLGGDIHEAIVGGALGAYRPGGPRAERRGPRERRTAGAPAGGAARLSAPLRRVAPRCCSIVRRGRLNSPSVFPDWPLSYCA
ncbi:M20/M25/M40 family metallo-hydrolase [Streptomyces mirabilis]|uniref:M20/M25/M40 family metallo-hydrolase n=1 Tax=Streptomyces mirabilis TaxID=68239 RepID=UPI0036DD9B33